MMMSLLLSWMLTDPSGYMTAKSPLWKYPPLNAFSVAFSSVKYYGSGEKRQEIE